MEQLSTMGESSSSPYSVVFDFLEFKKEDTAPGSPPQTTTRFIPDMGVVPEHEKYEEQDELLCENDVVDTTSSTPAATTSTTANPSNETTTETNNNDVVDDDDDELNNKDNNVNVAARDASTPTTKNGSNSRELPPPPPPSFSLTPLLLPKKSCLRRRCGSMPDLSVVSSSSLSDTATTTTTGGDEASVETSDHSTRSAVRFGTVEFREHGLVLGDHPDCSYGPPVQLDWECQNVSSHDVNDYELGRKPRRHKANMSLTYYQRKNILLNDVGLSKEEIKEATRKVEKEKMCRNLTKAMLPLAPVETIFESSSRKVKRAVEQKKQEKKEKAAFKKNHSVHGDGSCVSGSSASLELQAYGKTYKKASSSLPLLRSWRGK